MDLRASKDLRFSVSTVSTATVDVIVTMGSYRALVRFLNSLRTRMKSFFVSSESTLMHRNRYAERKDRFCNSHSDIYKNINVMMKKNI